MKEYIRLRRMGIAHDKAYELANLDKVLSQLVDFAIIVGGLLVLLLAYDWTIDRETEELQARIEREQKYNEQVTKLVADILNGHTIYDHANKTAYFIEVTPQEGL